MEKKSPLKINFGNKKLSDFFHLSANDQVSTLAILILLICIGLGYFVLFPMADAYRTARVQFANQSAYKQVLLSEQNNLQTLKTDIAGRSDFISKTEEAMPATSQIPELIVTLSNFANVDLLYMTNFTPKEVASTPAPSAAGENPAVTPPTPSYSTINISFDVSGSYANLKQFIKDMEDNVRPLAITSISIMGGSQISNTTTSSEASQSLHFTINANVYYESQ